MALLPPGPNPPLWLRNVSQEQMHGEVTEFQLLRIAQKLPIRNFWELISYVKSPPERVPGDTFLSLPWRMK